MKCICNGDMLIVLIILFIVYMLLFLIIILIFEIFILFVIIKGWLDIVVFLMYYLLVRNNFFYL